MFCFSRGTESDILCVENRAKNATEPTETKGVPAFFKVSVFVRFSVSSCVFEHKICFFITFENSQRDTVPGSLISVPIRRSAALHFAHKADSWWGPGCSRISFVEQNTLCLESRYCSSFRTLITKTRNSDGLCSSVSSFSSRKIIKKMISWWALNKRFLNDA